MSEAERKETFCKWEETFIEAPPPILQSCSGEAILVTDSAERPLQGLRLFGKTTATEISEEVVVGTGKNILPVPYADGDKTIDGMAITNEDGVLCFRGNASAFNYHLGNVVLSAGTYTISRHRYFYDIEDVFDVLWNVHTSDGESLMGEPDAMGETNANRESFSFTLTDTTEVSISLESNSVSGGIEVGFQIQLENGASATEWEAYTATTETIAVRGFSNIGDSGSVGVKVQGKNLLPYPYKTNFGNTNTVQKNGVTFTDNGDGTITANGTATAGTSFSLAHWGDSTILNLPLGVPITLSGTPSGGGSTTYRMLLKTHDGEKQVATDDGAGKTIKLNYPKCYLYIWIPQGSTVNNIVFKPLLELGTIKTEYEEYKEPQTFDVITPDGLASVGDVYDEIDFASGVFIQKIARGNEYSVLETPIETPLSAEQIEAFKALYTNYPNTTITNDSGATIAIEYIADTKTYIDNKFAELASAIANT